MAKFRRPKNPLAYLNHLMPSGSLRFFTRRGIGCMIRCPFCPTLPPQELSGYQRWRWMTAHIASKHHQENIKIVKIGSIHAVERSQERKVS